MSRDPRTDPAPGDRLTAPDGRWVLVHAVERGWVYYATFRPGDEAPRALLRKPLRTEGDVAGWVESCEANEVRP